MSLTRNPTGPAIAACQARIASQGQRAPRRHAREGAPQAEKLRRPAVRAARRARLLPRDADARELEAAHELGVLHDPLAARLSSLLEAPLGQQTLEALLADGGARLQAQSHAPRIVRRVGTLI